MEEKYCFETEMNKLNLFEKKVVNDCISGVKSGKEFLYLGLTGFFYKSEKIYTIGAVTPDDFFKRNRKEEKYKMTKATKGKLSILLKHDKILNEPENNWSIKIRANIYLHELKDYF